MRIRIRLEVWKPVLNYEGWYEVSSLGNVRRIKAAKRTRIGLILKPIDSPYGYFRVDLYKHGKRKRRCIHELVCEAFHGPKPLDKECVNHDNGIKHDNWEWNVEWSTFLENNKHAILTGLRKTKSRNVGL